MRIIVAAVRENCPAHLALTMEGVEHEVVMCEGDLGYGEQLARLWHEGKGFVLVEHDIVPWPGAMKQIVDCDFQWCSYPYPLNERNGDPLGHLGKALGVMKFGDRILQRFPDLPDVWAGVPWWNLDGHLEPELRNRHMVTIHQHMPPVAHVKIPAVPMPSVKL